MTRRIAAIAKHLCLGEGSHPTNEGDWGGKLFRFQVARRTVKIICVEAESGADSYGGTDNAFALEGELLVPSATSDEVASTVSRSQPS